MHIYIDEFFFFFIFELWNFWNYIIEHRCPFHSLLEYRREMWHTDNQKRVWRQYWKNATGYWYISRKCFQIGQFVCMPHFLLSSLSAPMHFYSWIFIVVAGNERWGLTLISKEVMFLLLYIHMFEGASSYFFLLLKCLHLLCRCW